MFNISSAELTHPGRKRSVNQDYVASFEPTDWKDLNQSGRVYIVADGVGGASDGEKASLFAAKKVLAEYYSNPRVEPGERLRRLFRQAGNDLYDHAEQSPGYKRMATTMVAAVIHGNMLTVANVGDSRAFLIRGGQITQITRDHNLVGEMLHNGEITEQEALRSGVKNRLTRSLGGELDVKVDVYKDIPLQTGDRIFLCSDGLTRYTLNQDILQLVGQGLPAETTQRAIDFANRHGGADNISATMVIIGDPLAEGIAHLPDEDETATIPGINVGRRSWFNDLLAGNISPIALIFGAIAFLGLMAAALLFYAWYVGWIGNRQIKPAPDLEQTQLALTDVPVLQVTATPTPPVESPTATSLPPAAPTLTLTPEGVLAPQGGACYHQAVPGFGLAKVFGIYGKDDLVQPGTDYPYYSCEQDDGVNSCTLGGTYTLPPTGAAATVYVQAEWWFQIPDIDRELCELDQGIWVFP